LCSFYWNTLYSRIYISRLRIICVCVCVCHHSPYQQNRWPRIMKPGQNIIACALAVNCIFILTIHPLARPAHPVYPRGVWVWNRVCVVREGWGKYKFNRIEGPRTHTHATRTSSERVQISDSGHVPQRLNCHKHILLYRYIIKYI